MGEHNKRKGGQRCGCQKMNNVNGSRNHASVGQSATKKKSRLIITTMKGVKGIGSGTPQGTG